ncbi:hypothetical protein Bp8pC_167 [Bacillus phage Bp8p-C]|uniref:Uncharacterized protein n=2 Tax=Agatevirus Bp8pC TaxID=1910937 RepID=A0A0A0PLR4_9CAUD|nr:hypothetical protein AXJ20_gp181 [Bacillus phage Bp8p-C]YP_009784467.1 hypothetical protein QLX39_gp181 [Bacillus phage Bp8p-T]AHJ87597.1 hypothetical protein Bp8pC_167 [Bacillus phage Bp8p-C]AHJ87808.1 hypothetical protein Bp8pT_167 [Bacillus phage Bp8p-T]
MISKLWGSIRKLGKWKDTEHTFTPPKPSGLTSPEQMLRDWDIESRKQYTQRYAQVKKEVDEKISGAYKYSADGKFVIIDFRKGEYNSMILDEVIKELIELGWEVATRMTEKEFIPPWYEDDPCINFIGHFFEVCVAQPGELHEAIKGTDFIVFGEESTRIEKEHVPQDMGKD